MLVAIAQSDCPHLKVDLALCRLSETCPRPTGLLPVGISYPMLAAYPDKDGWDTAGACVKVPTPHCHCHPSASELAPVSTTEGGSVTLAHPGPLAHPLHGVGADPRR